MRYVVAMKHMPTWLVNSFIYLSAAVIAVPLSKAFGLGSIIGYLGAGIAIDPWGLGLVTYVEDILHFAEFGVVLMLFLVGLELEPKRLWSLRRPIFGWGSAQVLLCTAGLFIAFYALGTRCFWRLAHAAGGGTGSGAVQHGHCPASHGRPQPVAHVQRPGGLFDFVVSRRSGDPDFGAAATVGRAAGRTIGRAAWCF